METRWSCGLADGDCAIDFGLIYFRYVRQIQFGEPLQGIPSRSLALHEVAKPTEGGVGRYCVYF